MGDEGKERGKRGRGERKREEEEGGENEVEMEDMGGGTRMGFS